MGVLGYWLFVVLGVVAIVVIEACVRSAAKQVPHIAHETLFTTGEGE